MKMTTTMKEDIGLAGRRNERSASAQLRPGALIAPSASLLFRIAVEGIHIFRPAAIVVRLEYSFGGLHYKLSAGRAASGWRQPAAAQRVHFDDFRGLLEAAKGPCGAATRGAFFPPSGQTSKSFKWLKALMILPAPADREPAQAPSLPGRHGAFRLYDREAQARRTRLSDDPPAASSRASKSSHAGAARPGSSLHHRAVFR